MRAFHNDQKIKDKYTKRVKKHGIADEIIKGQYWAGGKGCAVGCTIHGSNHAAYEAELGIPTWLAHLEDRLFENMQNDDSKKWPLKFLESINVGSNLELVKKPFMIFLLERVLNTFDHIKYPEIKKSINRVIELYKIGGSKEDFARAAAAANTNDANAAYAARAAAAAYAAHAAHAADVAHAADAAHAAAAANANAAAYVARAAAAANTNDANAAYAARAAAAAYANAANTNAAYAAYAAYAANTNAAYAANTNAAYAANTNAAAAAYAAHAADAADAAAAADPDAECKILSDKLCEIMTDIKSDE